MVVPRRTAKRLISARRRNSEVLADFTSEQIGVDEFVEKWRVSLF